MERRPRVPACRLSPCPRLRAPAVAAGSDSPLRSPCPTDLPARRSRHPPPGLLYRAFPEELPRRPPHPELSGETLPGEPGRG